MQLNIFLKQKANMEIEIKLLSWILTDLVNSRVAKLLFVS